VFYENSDKTLERTQHSPVDHDGGLLAVVFVGVNQAETLWHGKIQLDSAELPGPLETISDMKIDLGPVKCAVAFIDFVIDLLVLEGVFEGICCRLPNLIRAYVLIGLGRQLDMEILKSEGLVYFEGQLDDSDYLGFNLLALAGTRPSSATRSGNSRYECCLVL